MNGNTDHAPKDPSHGVITRLLGQWNKGDQSALGDVIPLVFEELRCMAARYLSNESKCDTLQPTALVNELYLRMQEGHSLYFENRGHFFFFAGRVMRRILVEHARARLTLKRGSGAPLVAVDDLDGAGSETALDPALLIALDDALQGLEAQDRRRGLIVELRYFAGMSIAEIADLFTVSERTVKREWRTAKLWLAREMGDK